MAFFFVCFQKSITISLVLLTFMPKKNDLHQLTWCDPNGPGSGSSDFKRDKITTQQNTTKRPCVTSTYDVIVFSVAWLIRSKPAAEKKQLNRISFFFATFSKSVQNPTRTHEPHTSRNVIHANIHELFFFSSGCVSDMRDSEFCQGTELDLLQGGPTSSAAKRAIPEEHGDAAMGNISQADVMYHSRIHEKHLACFSEVFGEQSRLFNFSYHSGLLRQGFFFVFIPFFYQIYWV